MTDRRTENGQTTDACATTGALLSTPGEFLQSKVSACWLQDLNRMLTYHVNQIEIESNSDSFYYVNQTQGCLLISGIQKIILGSVFDNTK